MEMRAKRVRVRPRLGQRDDMLFMNQIPALKKYLHVIGIGIQNNLTYRFNYLTRTLFSFIPLFAMLSLWRTIYASKDGQFAFRLH
jgi:ABC-type uncharacterized transport system permease subunit